jgi:hypothetical protein
MSIQRALAALGLALVITAAGCTPQRPSFAGDGAVRARDGGAQPDAAAWFDCIPGQTRCFGDTHQLCVASGEFTDVQNDDCAARMQVCVPALNGCAVCSPGALRCSDDDGAIETCRADGSGYDRTTECDVPNGEVCRGAQCRSLCNDVDVFGSNVGCEYYAVDLDNAALGANDNAAAQQYAVVVSNPDPRFSARVRVEWNTAPPGADPHPVMVASALIPPMDLEIFRLPPREVDCSMPGTYNTGTGTCLSSQAYRVTSTAPVVAFQFNPLENVFVFSNDASLLVPTNSLSGDYMVMGWPQTLASSPPETVLNPGDPTDLRGFVTVVGTQAGTHVRVTPRADVLPGGPIARRTQAGNPIDVVLGPFDVLNLETDGFEADLTGSVVLADRPVAVFSGSECSDVPPWFDLNDRRCCCDHLESQQFPRGTQGQSFFAPHMPSRTAAVNAAGGTVARVPNEPEFFRVLAVTPGPTHVRTTIPSVVADPASALLEFDLAQGEVRTLSSPRDFELTATAPVSFASFQASQENTGIPLNLPGGDGSFVPIPPVEQWRNNYVFLTPNSYAFDFVAITAPVGAHVELDGDTLPTIDCEQARSDGCVVTVMHNCPASTHTVYRCQLSYPNILPDLPYPMNIAPGRQRDGVHTVTASEPVEVIVSGFDLRVSYGYPAGTQLRTLF